MLRIGIVGLGNMGRNHLRVLTSHLAGKVWVTGVADPSPQSVAATAEFSQSIPVFADYRELLERVDAVIIAAPTPLHYAIAWDILEAGKHVLVEKPIALTVEEAERLVDLAESKSLILQVGHIERFNPAVRVLKDLVQGEEIVAIEAHRLSYFTPSAAYGNLVVDLMIHDIDVVNYLLNGRLPVSVAANAFSADGDFSHVQALLAYDGGVTASLHVSRLAHEKLRKLKLFTANKTFSVDYISRQVLVSTYGAARILEGHRGYKVETGAERYVADGEPLYLELREFVDCIVSNRRPETRGCDGLKALLVAQAVCSACRSGDHNVILEAASTADRQR